MGRGYGDRRGAKPRSVTRVRVSGAVKKRSWDEVEACRQPQDLFFTAPDTLTRVTDHGDLFAPLLSP